MKVLPDDPIRWKDRDADTHALEDRAAALVKAAKDVPPLGQEVVVWIRSSVLLQRSPGPFRRFSGLPIGARVAFVAALLLASVVSVGGATALWRKYVLSGPAAGARPAAGGPAKQPIHRTPTQSSRSSSQVHAEVPPPPVAVPATQPTSTPGTGTERERPAARTRAETGRALAMAEPVLSPVLPPATALDGQPSERETEARLLAQALLQLRQSHDPRGALTTLDRHALMFPNGVLEHEALRARLEAFIRLDDFKAALALLDGRRTFSDPLGADLLLTRAELRADVGRCGEALGDFSQILQSPGLPKANGVDERALYGRAVCLGRLGHDSRARTDLREHRRRFPTGKFAVEVERLLNGTHLTNPP